MALESKKFKGDLILIESSKKRFQLLDQSLKVSSKANCRAVNSSKKRTNEFVFTTMQCVFVCFLEEIEDSKKAF